LDRLILNVNHNIELDEFLANNYFSKKDIHLLKMEKRITCDGKVLTSNQLLSEDSLLTLDIQKEEPINIEPVIQPLSILYEDEYVLVVDKPAGILVHEDGNKETTLDNLVAGYYKQTNQQHPIYHIHRLDKETTGCILYCKQSYLVAYLDNLLQQKKIRRTYQAIVSGILKQDLTICKPIGKDRHVNNKYRISESGKQAITHVFVKKIMNNTTLVECLLETGRTHQIRVHLSSIHHPILGDLIYSNDKNKTMFLHSYKLRFYHPILQKELEIISENKNFENYLKNMQ